MNRHAEADLHYVGMGEVKTGSRNEVLRATLGSCIGIAFIWKKGGRCGLAHCLLPEAPGAIIGISARYVSQAIPSLLGVMRIRPVDYPDVEVIVTGGGRMFRVRPNGLNVGELNAQAAQRHLAARGLHVDHIEIGGRRGRQITIDCAMQSFVINQIERQPEEYEHECS
jgi:chemotaxis protein CheD